MGRGGKRGYGNDGGDQEALFKLIDAAVAAPSPAAPAPAPAPTVEAPSVVRAVAPARALAPAPVGPARFSGEAFLTHCISKIPEITMPRDFGYNNESKLRDAIRTVLESDAIRNAVDNPKFIANFSRLLFEGVIHEAKQDPALGEAVFKQYLRVNNRLRDDVQLMLSAVPQRWLGESYCYPNSEGLEKICKALQEDEGLRQQCLNRCARSDSLRYSYLVGLPGAQLPPSGLWALSVGLRDTIKLMLNAEDNSTYFASPEALKQAFFDRLSAHFRRIDDEQLKPLAGYIGYALERAYFEVTQAQEVGGRWAAAQPQNGVGASR